MPKFITITAKILAKGDPVADHELLMLLNMPLATWRDVVTAHGGVVTTGYVTEKAKAEPPAPALIENALTVAATERHGHRVAAE